MNPLLRKLLWVVQRKRKEEELRDEIQFHIEEEREELQAGGAIAEEANWAARRGLGNSTLVREEVRESWGWAKVERFANDVRYTLRMQRRTPLATAVIVLSLAIGIGANAAVFSVVDALLLRPLPFPHPERLVAIWLHSPGIGILRDWPSPGQYVDIKRENHSFSDVSISRLESSILNNFGDPQPVNVMMTSSNVFRMLGARPLMGRILSGEDDKPEASSAVLTYGAWSRIFGSDPNILGRRLKLDGRDFTVVGVLEPRFRLSTEVMPAEEPMEQLEVFLPLRRSPEEMQSRGDENYNLLAELRPGVSVQQAQADINLIANRIRLKDKRDRTFGMTVMSLQDQVVGDVRRVLLIILGSVMLVLLSACANVANILLTRGAGREKEIAIRAALGAGSKRLIAQLLTESVLLSLMGAAAGLLLAWAGLRIMRTLNPGNIPRLEDISINATVLTFTICLALATGIAFGLVPVFRALRVDLNTSLKSGGRRAKGDGGLRISRQSLRGLLVVGELALSLMLLAGAGLLVRSFWRILDVQPGFTTRNVLTMQVAALTPKYRNNEKASSALFNEMETRIGRLRGVAASGFVSALPLTGSTGWGMINVEGFTPPPGQELQVDMRTASADYFRALEIPMRSGRCFAEYDRTGSQKVAMVDERFAARFWPHGDAIGKHVWFDNPKKPFTIVGVVGSVKQYGLTAESKIVVYFPHGQMPWPQMFLAVRTSTHPAGLANAVVRQIHAADPTVAVFQVQTMNDLLARSLARQQFAATMFSAFALFALTLAAIGVYGGMSYLVTQATHDIGIRVALGAQSTTVLGLILRQGIALAVAGLCVGLVGAAVLTRAIGSLLFGVSSQDAVTFSSVSLLLFTITIVASLVPAQRALRIDPIVALRDE